MTEPVFFSPAGNARTIHDRCIVSCGIGEQYIAGLASTRAHCAAHSPEAWQLFYSYYPEGCPEHRIEQYAFKIYALRRAIDAGFRYVLWMDTSFQPVDSLEPLWKHIAEQGWYVPPQEDAKLARWCSDAALYLLGITREAAQNAPLVYSGIVGLDMQSSMGKLIWKRWERAWIDGAFNGAHRNVPGGEFEIWGDKFAGHVSEDPMVEGHRHDESALSWVLADLGLTPARCGFLTYESPDGFIDHHIPLDLSNAVTRKIKCL